MRAAHARLAALLSPSDPETLGAAATLADAMRTAGDATARRRLAGREAGIHRRRVTAIRVRYTRDQ